MKKDVLKNEQKCATPDISNCCKIIVDMAWDLYCKEAGMCAGAVDYWERVSIDIQDKYICKVLRGNNY